MPYNRLERRLAALLDSAPRVRRFAKASYQRVNYLLHGRPDASMHLHPEAAIERIPGIEGETRQRTDSGERFFGYFGLSPWSHDGGAYLFHEWRRHQDPVDICLYDRRTAESRVVARSTAWNFQQGSMTQWLNHGDGRQSIVFNVCVNRNLVCRIVGPVGEERTITWPIQAVHPEGTQALSLNYRRLSSAQPEYGYATDADNFSADQPLHRDGIWQVDLRTADSKLIVSLDDLTQYAPRPDSGKPSTR